MAVIVKLTYTQSGRPSLINLETMKSAYRMFEENRQKVATRINFNTNDFIIVDEDLETIHRLYQDVEQGIQQNLTWVVEDVVKIKNDHIKAKMIGDYNKNVGHKSRNAHTKTY